MIGVVYCGEANYNLWPISRDLHPVPFIRLADHESFIQKLYKLCEKLSDVDSLLIITEKRFYFRARREFAALNIRKKAFFHVVSENGGPLLAAAIACLQVREKFGGNMPILFLDADQHIVYDEEFAGAIGEARKMAEQNRLVLLGLEPEDGKHFFGYCEINGKTGAVARIDESMDVPPRHESALSGKWIGNTGIYCFGAEDMTSRLSVAAPETLAAAAKLLPHSLLSNTGDTVYFSSADGGIELAGTTLERVIAEASPATFAVEARFDWVRLTSLGEMGSLYPLDDAGNHVLNPEWTVIQDARNCDITTHERVVGVLGVDNLVIVDTTDALLVADKSRLDSVHSLCAAIPPKNQVVRRQHRIIHCPWGSYTLLETGERYIIKRLTIKPGESISLQLHYHRSEHWVVVTGMATVVHDEETRYIPTDESIYIKAGIKHRVTNEGMIDLNIIEVQTGDYLNENDIKRFSDLYGR